MLKIENLSKATKDKIGKIRWDRFIEKHEGPFAWEGEFRTELSPEMRKHFDNYDPVAETPQFIEIGSYDVLLPLGRKHLPDITILDHFFSQDLKRLVIYLTDTTYHEDDLFGYVAICDLISPENFYLTTFYHEWLKTEFINK
jgi:hypothetical protein